MAFVTPRASGLWEDRMSYFQGEDDADEPDLEQNDPHDDGRTPLDKTIDRIGMGSYQWTLLSLCGFGWMADNMWIQAIAIVLPRVQRHYAVPDSYIGTVSSSMFAGMMFGAIGWGTCSDLMGRSTAFNATLFFTAIFGILASFANTFTLLCISLFFLGSSVGGSMPTDGTLLLEHMPRGKEYLVTALSVFFSFGAVLSALVAIVMIPKHSCPPAPAPCDVSTENMGWRYTLMTLGLITLTMFTARMVFFRLHESPRYLVHAGRPHEAIESLQLISRFNGSELDIGLLDVEDHIRNPGSESAPFLSDTTNGRGSADAATRPSDALDVPNGLSTTLFDAEAGTGGHARITSANYLLEHADSQDSSPLSSSPPEGTRPVPVYSATQESGTNLEGHSFSGTPQSAPSISVADRRSYAYNDTPAVDNFKEVPTSPPPAPERGRVPRPDLTSRRQSRLASRSLASRRSSFYEVKQRVWWRLPRFIRRPLGAWLDRFAMVLAPEWLKTTLLVWAAWFGMSLAYTMFNVYLPKLLEARSAATIEHSSLEGTLWDVVIFTVGGCPGAVLGAYLIESPLGRRMSLAGSTFVTAFFCVVFVVVESKFAVTASTVGISLSATTMWAVLYGWTPEIFGTKVRGTACGTASALSRIGGMIAPILGGLLLMADTSFPVYTSIVIFTLSGVFVLMLSEQPGDSKKGGPSLMH
ncbi:MFS general substrate transporter [Dentipellis sp. KUC8613]|nr:MFS general substrate transporter [Dentipellis sp. KUC8613]